MSFSEADRMELDSTYSSSRKWDFLPGSFREGRRFDWRSMAIYRFVMTPKKFSCQSGLYLTLFFFFFSKDRGKTKQKPSNAKYVHIKKYRFPKAKDNHFENAIDFVWERFLCKWPSSNPDDDRFAGRAPVKSKCMGFAAYFAQWNLPMGTGYTRLDIPDQVCHQWIKS